MKCGEAHSTHLCEKSKTKPARCANCGGEHRLTSLKCPANPNNPTNRKKEPENKNPWTKKKTENSTATTIETPQKDPQKELYTTLREMLADLTRYNFRRRIKTKIY